jgi:hypothetical protein
MNSCAAMPTAFVDIVESHSFTHFALPRHCSWARSGFQIFCTMLGYWASTQIFCAISRTNTGLINTIPQYHLPKLFCGSANIALPQLFLSCGWDLGECLSHCLLFKPLVIVLSSRLRSMLLANSTGQPTPFQNAECNAF